MQMLTGNNEDYHWSIDLTKDPVAYTFRATNFHGSPQFEAEQIGRLLDIKMPPLSLCQSTPRRNLGPVIQYSAGVVPLGLRILKQHLLSWNLNGTILRAPHVTTWWVPYNFEAIMRYGHSVNTTIPEDPNEAEFPPTPWGNEVTIRIKSQVPPQVPAAPLPADDPRGSSAPGLSSGWKGPALGEAAPISTQAAALDGYKSPYSARTVEGQKEEPPAENLQEFRGLSHKDQLVHSMISWTTLESYPLRIGIGLPIPNPGNTEDFEEFHEAQLWEQTEDEWIIEKDHATTVYNWLMERFI
jgi:hypothetical protein